MLAARITYITCQVGMVAVLARFGSPEAVGEFVLALAVTAPLVSFANMQLRLAQATDAAKEYSYGEYSRLRSVTTALAFGAIVAIAFPFFAPSLALAIVAAGICKVIESLSDIQYGHLQRCGAVATVARSMLIRSVAALGATATAFLLFGNVPAVLLSISAGWLIVLAAHDLPAIRRLASDRSAGANALRGARLLALLGKVLPLGVAGALMSVQVNVPRYIAAATLDGYALGIVGALTYFFAVGQTLESVLTYPAVPRLAAFHAAGQAEDFARLLRKLCGIGAAAGLAALFVAFFTGRTVLTLVLGSEYAGEFYFFLTIVGATVMQSVQTLLLGALAAQRRLRTVFVIQTAVLVLTLAFCVVLSGWLGLEGLGIGILAAYFFGVGTCLILVRRSVPAMALAVFRERESKAVSLPDGPSTNGLRRPA